MPLTNDDIAAAYERYASRVRGYCARYLPEHADDLASQVWIDVCKGAATYEDRGWPMTAWLYRIAHSHCVDHIRKARRRPETALHDRHAVADPCEHIGTRIDAMVLLQTLHTPRARQAVWLTAQGYEAQEVAAMLGTTHGAVRALLRRARVVARNPTRERRPVGRPRKDATL